MDAPLNRIDRRLFVAGWIAAATFLGVLALPLHLQDHFETEKQLWKFLLACGLAQAVLLVEYLVQRMRHCNRQSIDLAAALFPPLRLMLRHRENGTEWIWLPVLGWRKVDTETRQSVAHQIETLMFVIVLLMLPLLGLDFLPEKIIALPQGMKLAVSIGTALIWWAFTIEFMMTLGLAPSRIAHCKQHWVELLVILLPLAAGLRLLRLGRLARVQQISKLSRAYRMRGAIVKLQRAAVLWNLTQRILRRSSAAELERVRAKILQHETELKRLRAEECRLTELCSRSGSTNSNPDPPERHAPDATNEQRAWAV